MRRAGDIARLPGHKSPASAPDPQRRYFDSNVCCSDFIDDGGGSAIVYTGYEWRARLELGGEAVLQVFALSEDGNALSGRWFLEAQDALGGDQRAVREGSGPSIVGVSPGYVKKQHNQMITISGTGLDGS